MASSKSTTVRMQRYYKVTKASPVPLRREDIQVEITQSGFGSSRESSQPNLFALSLLWAHYQACLQGILSENQLSPWEAIDLEDGTDEGDPDWVLFLKQMITDKEWVHWIQDLAEVKRRALAAFSSIQSDSSSPEESTHSGTQEE